MSGQFGKLPRQSNWQNWQEERVKVCYLDFQEAFDSLKEGLADQKGKVFVADAEVNNWLA